MVVDDGSSDGTVALARELAGRDPRLQVFVNSRLGMLGNTNRALSCRGSSSRWRPTRARLGSRRLGAGLACGARARAGCRPRRRARLSPDAPDRRGRRRVPGQKPPWRLDTRGMDAPRARMRRAFRGMAAGDMIYGVFRAAALEPSAGYRPVLVPDRLLLSELALHGTFAQARRGAVAAAVPRPGVARPPARGLLPRRGAAVDRAAVVAAAHGRDRVGLRRAGKGARLGLGFGRGAGWGLAVEYLAVSLRDRAWRRARRARVRVLRARNALLGRPARALLGTRVGRRLVRGAVLPGLRTVEDVLERHTAARLPGLPESWGWAPAARRCGAARGADRRRPGWPRAPVRGADRRFAPRRGTVSWRSPPMPSPPSRSRAPRPR